MRRLRVGTEERLRRLSSTQPLEGSDGVGVLLWGRNYRRCCAAPISQDRVVTGIPEESMREGSMDIGIVLRYSIRAGIVAYRAGCIDSWFRVTETRIPRNRSYHLPVVVFCSGMGNNARSELPASIGQQLGSALWRRVPCCISTFFLAMTGLVISVQWMGYLGSILWSLCDSNGSAGPEGAGCSCRSVNNMPTALLGASGPKAR